MARYHVYGVGNALVDLEYQVPETTLKDLGVDKSLMTLIEEERHHELLDSLAGQTAHPCGGGSAANTVAACAQLGCNTFYSCKVANDETGHFFLKDLQANGADTNLKASSLSDGITGKCIILVTPDGERSMSTFLGITREIGPPELSEAAIRDSEHVYIEGYLVPEPNARAAAVQARQIAVEAGVKTAMTLSDVNMVKFFRDGLMEIVGDGLDLVFSNEEEAKLMFDSDSLEDCVEGMKSIARQFVITRGPRGALLHDGETTIEITAQLVTPVDSNGAGDVYAGTFLYGLTHGMPFQQCGELAGAAATTLITRLGARLSGDELRAIGQRFAA